MHFERASECGYTASRNHATFHPVRPLNNHGLFSQNSSLIISTCSINTFAFPLLFLSFSLCVLLKPPLPPTSAVPAAQPPDSVRCDASFLGFVVLIAVEVEERDVEALDFERAGMVGGVKVDADDDKNTVRWSRCLPACSPQHHFANQRVTFRTYPACNSTEMGSSRLPYSAICTSASVSRLRF